MIVLKMVSDKKNKKTQKFQQLIILKHGNKSGVGKLGSKKRTYVEEEGTKIQNNYVEEQQKRQENIWLRNQNINLANFPLVSE